MSDLTEVEQLKLQLTEAEADRQSLAARAVADKRVLDAADEWRDARGALQRFAGGEPELAAAADRHALAMATLHAAVDARRALTGEQTAGDMPQFARSFRILYPDGEVQQGVQFPSGKCVIDDPARRRIGAANSFEYLDLPADAVVEWADGGQR